MVDASVVQTPSQPMSKDGTALACEGAMPMKWRPAKRRLQDMAARVT